MAAGVTTRLLQVERAGGAMVLKSSSRGFTLIEIVIVIAIIGILAALAVPKFQDLSGAAKVSASKAGLGSLRSTLAIRYAASATGGATASYPASLTSADFAGGDVPQNALSGNSGVAALTASVTTGNLTGTSGFWFVSSNNGNQYGKAGAYSDGTVDTSAY